VGRRIAVVGIVAALVGVFGFAAPSGGATSGESCKHVSGAALFQPPLPIATSNARVALKITAHGMKVYTCTGPGGALATVAFTVKGPATTNCRALSIAGLGTTTGTGVIRWAKGKPSTIAVKLAAPRESFSPVVTGTVTGGQFKGLKVSATLNFVIDVPMCATVPLSKATLTFAKGSKLVIGKPA
jgi:hypothetical protein